MIRISATVSATDSGRPSFCSFGDSPSASVAPPKAADRKPIRVTPICTADRKRFGLAATRATVSPRLPRWAIDLSWLSRRETRAISAAAKTPPISTKTKIRTMLRTVSFMAGRSRALSGDR